MMREEQHKRLRIWEGVSMRNLKETVLKTGAGFLLARCVIFSSIAPFGVSFLAASAGVPTALFALAGSVGGYLTLTGRIPAARYLAEVFLVLLLSPLLRIVMSERKRLYTVILLMASSIPLGLASLLEGTRETADWVMYIAEVFITVLGGYLFRIALENREEKEEERQGSRYILLMLSVASFSDILLYGISIGRSLCILIALCKIGDNRSLRTGAAAGLMAGIASDMTLGSPPLFSLTMALGGLIAAIFRKFGKILCALAFVTAGAVITVWGKAVGAGQFDLSDLYEYLAGAVLYLLLPAALARKEQNLWPADEKHEKTLQAGYPHADFLRRLLYDRLFEAAEAYMMVAEETKTMKYMFSEELIIPTLREIGCSDCVNRTECIEKRMAEKAFTLLRPFLEADGRIERRQLSDSFAVFCPQTENYCRQLEKLWYASRVQKSYNARLNQGMELLTGQYHSVCSLLGRAAQMIGEETVFDQKTEAKIEEELQKAEIKARVIALLGQRGQLSVYLEGENPERYREEAEKIIRRATGKSLKSCRSSPGHLIWKEEANLTFLLGSASRKKHGSNINGDYGSWFTLEERLYVLISDGMGSGKGARRESVTFGNMVEKLIRGGIDPASALRTAMDTRLLSQGMVPATADLLEVDLFGGGASFYKSGASPSYIKGKTVRKVQSSGLYGENTAVSREFLLPGDMVVMATDGAEEGLEKSLEKSKDTDPQSLCRELVTALSSEEKRRDDCSVVAILIKKAEKSFDKSATA